MLPMLPFGTERRPRLHSRLRIEEAGDARTPNRSSASVDRTTAPDFEAGIVRIESAALRAFDSAAIGVPARFSVEATVDAFRIALRVDGSMHGPDADRHRPRAAHATIGGLSLPASLARTRGCILAGKSPPDTGIVTLDARGAVIRPGRDVANFSSSEIGFGDAELPPASLGLRAGGLVALDAALGSMERRAGHNRAEGSAARQGGRSRVRLRRTRDTGTGGAPPWRRPRALPNSEQWTSPTSSIRLNDAQREAVTAPPPDTCSFSRAPAAERRVCSCTASPGCSRPGRRRRSAFSR